MSLPSEKSQWRLHPFHRSSHKPRVLSDGPLSLPFYVRSKSRSCQPSLQSISIQNWPFLSVSTAPIQAQATTLSCGQSFLSAFLGPIYSPTQKIRVTTWNLRQLMSLFSELAHAVHHTQKGNQGTSTWSGPPSLVFLILPAFPPWEHFWAQGSSSFKSPPTPGSLWRCSFCTEQVPE